MSTTENLIHQSSYKETCPYGYGHAAIHNFLFVSSEDVHRNSMQIHDYNCEQGAREIVATLGVETLKTIGARELQYLSEHNGEEQHFGGIQFKVRKRRKVTHIQILRTPQGGFALFGLGLTKQRQGSYENEIDAFRWKYVSYEENQAATEAFLPRALAVITGFDLGLVEAKKMGFDDELSACPHCNVLVGPVHDTYVVKGESAFYCSQAHAKAACGIHEVHSD